MIRKKKLYISYRSRRSSYEKRFKTKNILDSTTVAALSYLQSKLTSQREANFEGDVACLGKKNLCFSGGEFFAVLVEVSYQNNRFYVTSLGYIPEGSRTHFKRLKPTGAVV